MSVMNLKKTIGIIGCGNMGSAILVQNIKSDKTRRFVVFDKVSSKARALSAKYHIGYEKSIAGLLNKAGVVIVAVKPQDIDELLSQINEASGGLSISKKLIISIAAGVTIEYIESKISGKVKVIRAMPNMPGSIGEGITALTGGKFIGMSDLKMARDIFKSLGPTIDIKEEELIDAVTALSGSGPAYIFYIFDAMFKAARELGLSEDSCRLLVYQTIVGAIHLLSNNDFDALGLISKVASKGGTTEAALKVFNQKQLDRIIREAVVAAYKRAGELSL